MLALADALNHWADHPRAVPWSLLLHSGWSRAAPVRGYTLLAPPLAAAAPAVLSRLHNAILLVNPAAAELHAPIEPGRLEPMLGQLRGIHHVPIVLDRPPALPAGGRGFSVPSADLPPSRPPGPGLAVGLDIGGTGMKVCALRDGVVIHTGSAPTWPDGESGVDSLIARARALVKEVAGGAPIGSLGIGLAAPMGMGSRVVELSAVLRERVGDVSAFVGFADRVAHDLVDGPVALFNDLANLGRYLSSLGGRRLVRLQIGTSFGGCWIDANGDVYAVEMGRLIVDLGDDALPHPYLPLNGAMRSYLSNAGIARHLGPRAGHPIDARTAGHFLRALLDSGDPAGEQTLRWMAEVLLGVVAEMGALLPGVTRVEVGGSMLLGPAGRRLEAMIGGRGAVPVTVAAKPGYDGAIAAAVAPRVTSVLKGHRQV